MQLFGVLAFVYKIFEVLLETVYVRPQWHHPVLVESLLYEIHFFAAHVSQAKQNAFFLHSYG